MKVKCIYNTGEAYKGIHMPIGYSEKSQFNIEINKEYLVMGISLWDGLLLYLIDEGGIPNWYPYQLFSVLKNTIPLNWYFKDFREIDSKLHALWGFKELCMMDDYYDHLLERQEAPIRIYFNHKKELEKYYEEQQYLD